MRNAKSKWESHYRSFPLVSLSAVSWLSWAGFGIEKSVARLQQIE